MTNTRLRTIFLFVAIIIVIGSVMFTNNLAGQLAQQERKKMELWAQATRQLVMADENTDIDFISSIIQDNTLIPVYMTDAEGNFLQSRNVKEPKKHVDRFYKKKIANINQRYL